MAKRVVSLAGRVIVPRGLPTPPPRLVIVSREVVVSDPRGPVIVPVLRVMVPREPVLIDPCGPVIVPVMRVIVPCGIVVSAPRGPVIVPVIAPCEHAIATAGRRPRWKDRASRLPTGGGERWQGEAAAPGGPAFTERQLLAVNPVFGWSMRPWESVPTKGQDMQGLDPRASVGPETAARCEGPDTQVAAPPLVVVLGLDRRLPARALRPPAANPAQWPV
jgi:hypothetical protein